MKRAIIEVADVVRKDRRLARAVREGRDRSTKALVKQSRRALRKAGIL